MNMLLGTWTTTSVFRVHSSIYHVGIGRRETDNNLLFNYRIAMMDDGDAHPPSSDFAAKNTSNSDVRALEVHCDELGISLDDLVHITEDEMNELNFSLKEKLIIRKLKTNLDLMIAEANRVQILDGGGKSKGEITSNNIGHTVEAAKLGWDIAQKFL